jgi:hypothetical protein
VRLSWRHRERLQHQWLPDLCDTTRESRFRTAPTTLLNSDFDAYLVDDDTPSIAMDRDGNAIALWRYFDRSNTTFGSDYDIFFAKSTDYGATWSDAAAFNPYAASDMYSDTDPQLVTNGSGTWIAIWVLEYDTGGSSGNASDISLSRSTDAGITWSVPRNLSGDPNDRLISVRNPQLATDGAGTWIIAWASSESFDGELGTDTDILFSRSTDDGITWTAAAPLNTDASTDQGSDWAPQIAADRFGHWIAVWQSNVRFNNGLSFDTDIAIARSSDNAQTWSNPAPLNDDAGFDKSFDRDPQIATDGNDVWVAVWCSGDDGDSPLGYDEDILVARSADNGLTWTLPSPLNNAAETDLGYDRNPRLATDGAGNWIVAWDSNYDLDDTIGTDSDILWTASFDNGISWTPAAAVDRNAGFDTNSDYRPIVTTNDRDRWLIVWTTYNSFEIFEGADSDINLVELTAQLSSRDCNGDLIPDECELADNDCNANTVPDDCELDFDSDGVIDVCDTDIDNDGVLNESDVCDDTPMGTLVSAWGAPKGDIDDDCVPTVADYAYLKICLSISGPGIDPFIGDCANAFDFDDDNDVDLQDFAAFARVVE